jgi:hypothetical protein
LLFVAVVIEWRKLEGKKEIRSFIIVLLSMPTRELISFFAILDQTPASARLDIVPSRWSSLVRWTSIPIVSDLFSFIGFVLSTPA